MYHGRVAHPADRLTIGEVSQRSGVATSALRFYESVGLFGDTPPTD